MIYIVYLKQRWPPLAYELETVFQWAQDCYLRSHGRLWNFNVHHTAIFFFSFIYLFILLYNIVLVLPYIDMNLPWVYMCSPSWTPLPPPSPSHPSGSSQCTSPERPVSCIKPGLAIHFTCNNLHVSVPFSHIILPSPSPTESKRHNGIEVCSDQDYFICKNNATKEAWEW